MFSQPRAQHKDRPRAESDCPQSSGSLAVLSTTTFADFQSVSALHHTRAHRCSYTHRLLLLSIVLRASGCGRCRSCLMSTIVGARLDEVATTKAFRAQCSNEW